ncbi:hypothetical protein D3C83_251550 [compost metagenome]
MDELRQRRRFFQRREGGALQVLDGGDPHRFVFRQGSPDFDGDREVLRQFAAILQ